MPDGQTWSTRRNACAAVLGSWRKPMVVKGSLRVRTVVGFANMLLDKIFESFIILFLSTRE